MWGSVFQASAKMVVFIKQRGETAFFPVVYPLPPTRAFPTSPSPLFYQSPPPWRWPSPLAAADMPPDTFPRSTSFSATAPLWFGLGYSAFDFRFSRPFYSSFPCQFPMASRVWVLPLVVAVLLAGGAPAIGLVRAPASVGICPASTATDAILRDQDFCLIPASPSVADFTGVVEVCHVPLDCLSWKKHELWNFWLFMKTESLFLFSKRSVLIVSVWFPLAKKD